MPPKYKVCYVCGREFGSASLDIHQKQCLVKREKEQALLPPHLRTALKAPAENMSNEQGFENWKQSLPACGMCGRTFLPDRLIVHQRSCKGEGKRGSAAATMPPPQDEYEQSPPPARQANARNRPPSGNFGKTTGGSGGGGISGFGGGNGNAGGGGSGYGSGGGFGSTAGNGFGSSGNSGGAGFDSGFGYDPPASQMAKTSLASIKPAAGKRPPSGGSAAKTSAPPAATKASPAQKAPGPGPSGRPAPFSGGNQDSDLVACRTCGRSFNPDRIEKHENICQDVTNHTRKTFDSSKARVQGTEMESVKVKPSSKKAPATGTKWRAQHADFMNAVKQARIITKIQKEGGDLSQLPPPPPSLNPDYVTCPHCNRRFNETAADRHIPKCKTTINKPKPPPTSVPPRQQTKTAAAPKTPQRTAAPTQQQQYSSSSSYGNSTSNFGSTSSGSYGSGSGSSGGYSNYPVSTSTMKQPTSARGTGGQSSASASKPNTASRTSSATARAPAPGRSPTMPRASGPATSASSSKLKAFCGECGTKYNSERMKFCGDCGCAR